MGNRAERVAPAYLDLLCRSATGYLKRWLVRIEGTVIFVTLQRSSISPGDKYNRPRTPQETHHSHHSQNHHDHPMHIKKMKKEQDKDIGHVSVCTALLFLLIAS